MKIAAAYTSSHINDIAYNIKATQEMVLTLAQQSVDFVLFPELNISGYIKSSENLQQFYAQQSQVIAELKTFSQQTNCAFSVGYPQLIDGKNYIAQSIFYRGDIINTHYKTHLGPTEQATYHSGNELKIVNLGNQKIGTQICFESHFPELAFAQTQQGATILAIPFASPHETAQEKIERFQKYLCARAYDNSVYVISCNLTGYNENNNPLSGLGLIIDPKGNTIATATSPDSGYCIAEIDEQLQEHIYNSKMAHFNQHRRVDLMKKIYQSI